MPCSPPCERARDRPLSLGIVRDQKAGVRRVVSDIVAIREIIARHGRLSVDVNSLEDDSDLHYAGLTSLATVNVMLALEDRFDIEFPEAMLSRKTFSSLEAIAEAIADLMR
jgi:acyl carrier protein